VEQWDESDPLALKSLHEDYSTNCTREFVAMSLYNLSCTNAANVQAIVEQGGAEVLVQLLVRASDERTLLEITMAKRGVLLNEMHIDRTHLQGHVNMANPHINSKQHSHPSHSAHTFSNAEEVDDVAAMWREELERTIAKEIRLGGIKRRVHSASEKALNSCAETMKLSAAAIGNLTAPKSAAHNNQRSVASQELGQATEQKMDDPESDTAATAQAGSNSMIAHGGGHTRAAWASSGSGSGSGSGSASGSGSGSGSGSASGSEGGQGPARSMGIQPSDDEAKFESTPENADSEASLHMVYSRSITALVGLLWKGEVQHAARALFNLATKENAQEMLALGVISALTKLAVDDDESGMSTRARLRRKMEKQEREKQEAEKQAAEEAKTKEQESHTQGLLFTHKQSEYWKQARSEKVELRTIIEAHETTKRNARRRKDKQSKVAGGGEQLQEVGDEEEEGYEEDEDFIKLRGRAQCAALLCRLSSHESLRHAVMFGTSATAVPNASVVTALVQCAQSNRQDLQSVHHCVSALCNFSCEVELRQLLVNNGVVPELVRLSGYYDEQIRQGCAASFSNLACDSRCHKALVEQGAMPALVIMGLVASNSHLTRNLCCRAIFNLLTVGQPLLDKVLEQDGVRGISELCYLTFYDAPPAHIRRETEHICAVSLCNITQQKGGQQHVMQKTPIKVLLRVAEFTKVLHTQEVSALSFDTARHCSI
jgi:hypothetical protein